MGSQAKKWIVRNQEGHIYGPFESTKLRELLFKGMFTGDEDVAIYPAGDWAPMSTDAELYEIILESIGREKNISRKDDKTASIAEKKQEIKSSPKPTSVILGETKSKKIKKESENQTDPPPIIEMNEEKQFKKEKTKSIIPYLLFTAAIALLVFAITSTRKSSKSTLTLLGPQIRKNQDAGESQKFLIRGWANFYKDTYSSYIQAEEAFVKSVEASSTNTEALVMLLMTYKELWAYTKQSAEDQSVIEDVFELLSKAEPYGVKKNLGQIIKNMILSEDGNVLSQIDGAIQVAPQEIRLFSLKADFYYSINDLEQAYMYYEKTAELIHNWAKPFFMMGLCLSKLGRGSEAQGQLVKALQMNPQHTRARIQLGIVEAKYFNHQDKAREQISVALQSNDKIPPEEESLARSVLAGSVGDKSTTLVQGGDQQAMNIADQYFKTKNYLAAQAQYKVAFEANPKNARAALRVAESLWQIHQTKSAFEYLQKAISADSKFLPAYLLMAQYRVQRYDFDNGAKSLETAIKVQPKSYEVYRAYADLFFQKGDLATAEKFALQSLKIYDPDVRSQSLMSKIYLAKKDVVRAIQTASKAVTLDATSAEALTTLAKAKVAYEGVKSASEFLQKQIDKFPTNLDLRIALADIYLQDEQLAAAKPILEQVIAADSQQKKAYLLLGDVNFLNNDFESALNNYFTSVQADPSDPTGLFKAGEVYLKAAKGAEAQKQFQLVIQTNNLYPKAHYSLAKAYFSMGMGDLALQELDKEKKLNPNMADSYEYAGDVQMVSRKFQLAAKEYQKASEIRPYGAQIYIKLAKAYYGQGSHDPALAMLRLAAAKESGVAEIYLVQGQIYEARGQGAEAAKSYKQYLRIEPSPIDKEQILKKIEELE